MMLGELLLAHAPPKTLSPADMLQEAAPVLLAAHNLAKDPQLPKDWSTRKPCCGNDCVFALCTSNEYCGLVREIQAELAPLASALKNKVCAGHAAAVVPIKPKPRCGKQKGRSQDQQIFAKRLKVPDKLHVLRQTREEAFEQKLGPRVVQLRELKVFDNSRWPGRGKRSPPCMTAVEVLTSSGHTRLACRAQRHGGDSFVSKLGVSSKMVRGDRYLPANYSSDS